MNVKRGSRHSDDLAMANDVLPDLAQPI